MKVFILATCRMPELFPMTELVFNTLRVGFPTADVHVTMNAMPPAQEELLSARCAAMGCAYDRDCTIHHKWIENLVENLNEPFCIVDTDMIFYESVEQWPFHNVALAGCRIPEWVDEYSWAITRSRLHPSLLFMNPGLVKGRLSDMRSNHPDGPFTPIVNPYHPLIVPFNERNYFYDTCSMLYHMIGGTAFTDRQKDAFFHFNFGTIPDLVLPRLDERVATAMEQSRKAILVNPELGRGAWRYQEQYYAARQFVDNGEKVAAPIGQNEAGDAAKLNEELCCGNRDAMAFNDLWYRYVHGIDDLIDTMRDGRPVMSKEEIISLFFNAALFYNSAFYKQHQALLFPIVLNVTNTYADSVAWERSPQAHLRVMGDVFRCCGDEMYVMVALICGGEQHMRRMSALLKERDWLGQHDAEGNPT